MSLEDAINGLAAALDRHTAALTGAATTGTTAAAPAKGATKTAAAKTPPKEQASEPVPTLEALQKAAVEFVGLDPSNRDKLKSDVYAEFGASKAAEVPEENRAAALKKVKALTEAYKAANPEV